MTMPLALITGASTGLGYELAAALAEDGWELVIDARRPDLLDRATARLAGRSAVTAICGDIADPAHRGALQAAVAARGQLDLLVHNASTLGPTPLPQLTRVTSAEFARVLEVNVLAPTALTGAVLPALQAAGGVVLGISSDAAVEHYPGWGAYGAAKAALDHVHGTLAVEHPELHVYAVDPGDMRTEMHRAAFPGEDISDRPDPATVVPALLRLLAELPPSGRYRAADWQPISVTHRVPA
jgi:NAD(P)-dependent dehydrogenase (short-subunit alcohol dehydrogenase family)